MFCEYCGNEYHDDTKFCIKCGRALDGAPVRNGYSDGMPTASTYVPGAAAMSPQAEYPQRNNRPILIGILVGLIIIALVLIGVFFFGGSQPSQPSQSSPSSQPAQPNSSTEQAKPQDAQQSGQQQNGQSQNAQQAPSGAAAAQNPSSVNATSGEVTLKGKLIRQERTTDQTGMGWASVDYMLLFESPVTITYQAPGGVETNTFTQIQVSSVISSVAIDPDANAHLSSLNDESLQSYVGKYVSVTGKIMETGTAHTYGHARFSEFAIALI